MQRTLTHPALALRSFGWMSLFRFSRTHKPLVLRGEIEREDDGRWIADIVDLPGVMAYGATKDEAIQKATALAYRVIADRIEHGDMTAKAGIVLDLCPA